MKDGLRFEEDYGDMIFVYTELDSDGFEIYEISETIPAKIIKKGKKAMLKYASREINKVKKKYKKQKSIEDNIKKNHIPIQTKYKGTSLEGRIVEATSEGISIELDKPSKGESYINFGFGSAIAGHYVFTDDSEISQAGYDAAYRALCWAYEEFLDKPKKDLVDSLNEELEDSEEI